MLIILKQLKYKTYSKTISIHDKDACERASCFNYCSWAICFIIIYLVLLSMRLLFNKTKKNEREREREALIAHENASAWLAMGEKYALDNNIIHGLRLFCSSLPLALSSAYLRIFKEKEWRELKIIRQSDIINQF